MSHRLTKRVFLMTAAAGAMAGSLASPSFLFGDDGQPRDHDSRIVNRHQRVDSRTYSEWTAAWWQWAVSFDLANNPILDPDGSAAGNGQSGPVWFLAGTFGGSAVRNVTIPAGKHLLVPVANFEWDTVPGFANPLGLPDPLSVDDIRAIAKFAINGTEATCSIDGREVRNLDRFRVQSPVFSMNFDPELAGAFGYPAPYVRTAVSDGYWLIVKPLAVGSHVIHFTGSNANSGFALDVTYNITVEE